MDEQSEGSYDGRVRIGGSFGRLRAIVTEIAALLIWGLPGSYIWGRMSCKGQAEEEDSGGTEDHEYRAEGQAY